MHSLGMPGKNSVVRNTGINFKARIMYMHGRLCDLVIILWSLQVICLSFLRFNCKQAESLHGSAGACSNQVPNAELKL